MRLRKLDNGPDVVPGATITLPPGRLHLLMVGLEEPPTDATRVPFTLVFEKAGKIDVELRVMALGAASPDAHRH